MMKKILIIKIKDYINEHKETTVINTTVMVETLNRAKGPHDIVEKYMMICMIKIRLLN